MAARFASNLIVLLAGAVLVPLTLGLGAGAVGWIALGIGCVAAVTVLAAFPLRGRGHAQRRLDACVALIAAWTIVASRSFGGSTVQALAFASGCAFAVLGAVGLVAHERHMERASRALMSVASDGHLARAPERVPIGVAK